MLIMQTVNESIISKRAKCVRVTYDEVLVENEKEQEKEEEEEEEEMIEAREKTIFVTKIVHLMRRNLPEETNCTKIFALASTSISSTIHNPHIEIWFFLKQTTMCGEEGREIVAMASNVYSLQRGKNRSIYDRHTYRTSTYH